MESILKGHKLILESKLGKCANRGQSPPPHGDKYSGELFERTGNIIGMSQYRFS